MERDNVARERCFSREFGIMDKEKEGGHESMKSTWKGARLQEGWNAEIRRY